MRVRLDHKLHFLGCFSLASIVFLFSQNLLLVFAIPFAIGLLKEWGDSLKENNYWSWSDILANSLGAIAFILATLAPKVFSNLFS